MEKYRVTIKGQEDSFAGYIKHSDYSYFFHLFKTKTSSKKALAIWLNGGPGCTSMDGLYLETGPFRFIDGEMVRNQYSWSELIDIVFVDQPSGTGYSMGKPADTIETVVSNFSTFLMKFKQDFPEYEDADIYLTGESFAGIYIPYFTQEILRNDGMIKGIIIGNGWIAPEFQYYSIVKFAKQKQLVTGVYQEKIDRQFIKCKESIDAEPGYVEYNECESLVHIIQDASMEG